MVGRLPCRPARVHPAVTAQWRPQHVVVPVLLRLDGPMNDLTEVPIRHEIENRQIGLLLEHGLGHLDLHEITTSPRVITQTIAADLFARGASAPRRRGTPQPRQRALKNLARLHGQARQPRPCTQRSAGHRSKGQKAKTKFWRRAG
jgi:hypothetical protein